MSSITQAKTLNQRKIPITCSCLNTSRDLSVGFINSTGGQRSSFPGVRPGEDTLWVQLTIYQVSHLKGHFIIVVNGKWLFRKEPKHKEEGFSKIISFPWFILGD